MASKLRVLGILTILIIFPLMSWYYLKTGYNYQMDSRAELKDYGKLPNFAWSTQYSDYSIDSLENKMSVLSFIGEDKKNTEVILEVIQKLNIQFGDNPNLKLLTFPLLAQRNGVSNFVTIQKEKKINPFQHKIIQAPESDLKNWLGEQIKYPVEWRPKENDAPDVILEKRTPDQLKEYPFFVLIDNKKTIRNFYNIDDTEEVKRMVEHIALLLPRDVRPGIEFEREKEK